MMVFDVNLKRQKTGAFDEMAGWHQVSDYGCEITSLGAHSFRRSSTAATTRHRMCVFQGWLGPTEMKLHCFLQIYSWSRGYPEALL
jgi:hypothetical protein